MSQKPHHGSKEGGEREGRMCTFRLASNIEEHGYAMEKK